jgi:hypothetical protein
LSTVVSIDWLIWIGGVVLVSAFNSSSCIPHALCWWARSFRGTLSTVVWIHWLSGCFECALDCG